MFRRATTLSLLALGLLTALAVAGPHYEYYQVAHMTLQADRDMPDHATPYFPAPVIEPEPVPDNATPVPPPPPARQQPTTKQPSQPSQSSDSAPYCADGSCQLPPATTYYGDQTYRRVYSSNNNWSYGGQVYRGRVWAAGNRFYGRRFRLFGRWRGGGGWRGGWRGGGCSSCG